MMALSLVNIATLGQIVALILGVYLIYATHPSKWSGNRNSIWASWLSSILWTLSSVVVLAILPYPASLIQQLVDIVRALLPLLLVVIVLCIEVFILGIVDVVITKVLHRINKRR